MTTPGPAVEGSESTDRHTAVRSSATPRISPHWWFGAIAIFGLLLRLYFLYRSRGWSCELCDSNYYSMQGGDVADGKWFIEPYGWNLRGIIKPSAAHPPLMSSYLAIWSFFGMDSFLWHRVAACVLGGLTVFVVGSAARRMTGTMLGGVVAACIAAVYPNLWMNDLNLQAESIFILTTAIVLDRAYAFWHSPTARDAVWLGLAIALCALSRAEGLLLFPLLLLPLCLRLPGRGWWPRIRLIAAGGIAGVVLMAPWIGYNLSRFAEPVYLSVGSGYVMELGNCDATYDWDSPYFAYWTYQCDRDPQDAGRAEQLRNSIDESAGEVIRRERAMEYIRDHLGKYPIVAAFRTLRVFDLFRPADNVRLNALIESREEHFGWTALGMYYALTALSFVGVVSLWKRRIPIIPVLAIFASVVIAMAVAFGITRYRVAWDVALCLLAAAGVTHLVQMTRSRTQPAEAS